MLITIDTEKDDELTIRSVIGFLAHLYNLEPNDVEGGTNGDIVPEVLPRVPLVPVAPNAATLAAIATSVAPVAAIAQDTVTTVPAPVSNVVNFPVPPPPPNVTTAAPIASASPVPSAAGVSTAVSGASVEYDAAGIPWDARIHQKGKSKKKDGTWKLQKGIDTAIVQAVTTELAARKIATPNSPSGLQQIPAGAQVLVPPPPPAAGAVPPPPPPAAGAVPPPPAAVAPQVSLPEANSVPLPPQQGNASATVLPAPNNSAPTSVPVSPTAVSGAGGGAVTYRSLIDKMTAGTRENKLTANKVLEIAQACGCPNLQQLNQMPQVWADVDAKIDLAIAGLL